MKNTLTAAQSTTRYRNIDEARKARLARRAAEKQAAQETAAAWMRYQYNVYDLM